MSTESLLHAFANLLRQDCICWYTFFLNELLDLKDYQLCLIDWDLYTHNVQCLLCSIADEWSCNDGNLVACPQLRSLRGVDEELL